MTVSALARDIVDAGAGEEHGARHFLRGALLFGGLLGGGEERVRDAANTLDEMQVVEQSHKKPTRWQLSHDVREHLESALAVDEERVALCIGERLPSRNSYRK